MLDKFPFYILWARIYSRCANKFAPTVISLFLITACSPVPDCHVVTPEPSNWTANSKVNTKITTQWLNEFADTKLTALVNEALRQNYALKAAALRVTAAREQAVIDGAPRLPQLNLAPIAKAQ